MIITIALLLIGILVLAGSLYYYFKEKADPESRKIYMIISLIAAVVTIGALIKLAAG